MGQRLENAKALYLEAIRDGHATEAIGKYASSRYTQHSTPVKDGQEGFGEFRYATADIFDTDDDARLIEHWDMIEEIADDTVSGHSQIDGPTEPTDLDKTEENKALVRAFPDDVLKNGRSDKVTQYVSGETYIQHNPQIADGLDGLQSFLADLAQQGHTMAYEEIHNVIGCGDFVAALSKMNLAGADMAVIDLFRVADGRIVEHWDVMEEITPEETWVNSGKF